MASAYPVIVKPSVNKARFVKKRIVLLPVEYSNHCCPPQNGIQAGLPQSGKKLGKKKNFSRSWKSQVILIQVSENELF